MCIYIYILYNSRAELQRLKLKLHLCWDVAQSFQAPTVGQLVKVPKRRVRPDNSYVGLSPDKTCGYGSKPWYLVNPKIAGKWMFIPLKMYL